MIAKKRKSEKIIFTCTDLTFGYHGPGFWDAISFDEDMKLYSAYTILTIDHKERICK